MLWFGVLLGKYMVVIFLFNWIGWFSFRRVMLFFKVCVLNCLWMMRVFMLKVCWIFVFFVFLWVFVNKVCKIYIIILFWVVFWDLYVNLRNMLRKGKERKWIKLIIMYFNVESEKKSGKKRNWLIWKMNFYLVII